jgi:vang-like
MEPDTYGGLVNSAPLVPPSSISSINTNNYERRQNYHQKKKRQDNQDERIEVKILPQDDNWGETTTITCNGGNDDTLTTINETNIQLNEPIQHVSNKINHRTRSILICHFAIYLLCLIAFLSPILFLTLPYILNRTDSIIIDDYTLLLTIIFKIFLLFIGTLLLLYRRRNTIYLPRIHIQKIFFLIVLISIVFTYWLYYIFKLLQSNYIKYDYILSITSTYEDLLLFLLLLTAITLEIKWLYPKWIVKIVRSPDGQTRQYTIGKKRPKKKIGFFLNFFFRFNVNSRSKYLFT